jgi:glycosyltransferase involved in cell wall biosynthesis/2-polyprenyl-3-methyl-5-hydroxy-6-metoxy-1,4-benzoquinol methylase
MTFAFLIDSVEFTTAVRDGQTSLGGSESACLGLARALAQRHDVHIFATKLSPDAAGLDASRCTWHALDDFTAMNQFIEWDVVVALRAFWFFGLTPVIARLRMLWSQDLLVPGEMQRAVMAVGWALDHIAYVSEYHRRQWEDLQPDLAPLGYVTRNGWDPAHLPATSHKDPHRIIHISRPERGLRPILQMWPALREKYPQATLQVCRYSSMYDRGPGSWSEVCESFDRGLKIVHDQVGGIEYLGELNKPQLYQAISNAAVMWYPGVSTFAETSCIAAVEAQACGTPFVGSLKGALPETARPSFDAGLLMAGVAEGDPDYHAASIAAVGRMLDGCARNTFEYRKLQQDGRKHVGGYTYESLAHEWEDQIQAWFKARYEGNKLGVLRQLLHEDDHVAAKVVATDIMESWPLSYNDKGSEYDVAREAAAFCDHVIAGKDQTAEQYGAHAVQNPLHEAEFSDRFKLVLPEFAHCKHVLDIACGNGAFAIALALASKTVSVHGLDYSAANIERATQAAAQAGVADRCIFKQASVYDFDRQIMHDEWTQWVAAQAGGKFDGLFVGEFIEHVGACTLLVDALEAVLQNESPVIYTCPQGACLELMPRGMPVHRGHVHRFHHDDLKAVFGPKAHFAVEYMNGGVTLRGNPIGNWLIRYVVAPNRPAGQRPLRSRIERTRPLQRLSVGVLVKDAELDLGRCLESVWNIADEIVVGDAGSQDDTKAIAEKFGARVIDLVPVLDQPEGFAGARNAILAACAGNWFLWIDADEMLLDRHLLRRYLDGSIFRGYVLHQTHLYIDMAPTYDKPVRLFKPGPDIRFYGCVHEQPQQGDANGDIYPSLEPFDVKLAHLGYLTEQTRHEKRVSRNLPLLIRDQEVFGNRLLGQVLRLREYVIQADEFAASGYRLKAEQGWKMAVQIFARSFDDPGHKYHKLARPWYEAALQHLKLGYECQMALAMQEGGLQNRPMKADRVWVRDVEEASRLMAWKLEHLKESLAPVRFKVDPFVLPVPVETELTA